MRICFVDDTGDPGCLPEVPTSASPSSVLSMIGAVVRADDLSELTRDILKVKSLWPHVHGYSDHLLDRIDVELKGSSVRNGFKVAAAGGQRALAVRTADGLVDALEARRVALVGKVFVKYPGATFDGQRLYNQALLYIVHAFQQLLADVDDEGIVIVDSRNEGSNRAMAHSIFTRKYAESGDPFDRLQELPTFADSKNHAGLQMVDWLASGLIAPMAWRTYCVDDTPNFETDQGHADIVDGYRDRIAALQYVYKTADGWRGGLHTSDHRGNRSPSDMFERPDPAAVEAVIS